MTRLLLTQVFPFLLPLRSKQKRAQFYSKLKKDENCYASDIQKPFEYLVYETKSELINYDSGFDLKYQYNKVFNLKLAAKTINGIVIKPNETFSFWWLVKDAQKYLCFKPGLNLVRGKISEVNGGGLCQLSCVLYELFLHTKLSTVERVPHDSYSVYNKSNKTKAMDATINEGWIDLKVKNYTAETYQIILNFDEKYLYAKILTNVKPDYKMTVYNRDYYYFYKNGDVYQKCSVDRLFENFENSTKICQHLYTDCTKIEFDHTLIEEEIELEERT